MGKPGFRAVPALVQRVLGRERKKTNLIDVLTAATEQTAGRTVKTRDVRVTGEILLKRETVVPAGHEE